MYAPRVLYSAIFFVLVMALLIVSKPSAFFKDDGEVKGFGLGRGGDATPLPLATVTVIVAVLAMFIFTMIDAVWVV